MGLAELGEAHLGKSGQLQQNVIMKKLEKHPFSSPPTLHFLVSQLVHMGSTENILSFAWHSATIINASTMRIPRHIHAQVVNEINSPPSSHIKK